MGKTRDLFKKTGDMKGTVHARMGTIKDWNDKDLTEAEEIRKRWQEYTEELYQKKVLMSQITMMKNHSPRAGHHGSVKWALRTITTNKASGGDRIPAELFKILKMMLLKCYTQYVTKFGKLSRGHRTGKGQFSFHCQRMFKLLHNCAHFTC